jgi:hypothetical protein
MATRVAAPKPSPIFAQIPFGCGGCVGTGPVLDPSEPGSPADDGFWLGSSRDAIARLQVDPTSATGRLRGFPRSLRPTPLIRGGARRSVPP